jgi:hypothetical protein
LSHQTVQRRLRKLSEETKRLIRDLKKAQQLLQIAKEYKHRTNESWAD